MIWLSSLSTLVAFSLATGFTASVHDTPWQGVSPFLLLFFALDVDLINWLGLSESCRFINILESSI